MSNVKGVTRRDKLTENYHSAVTLSSTEASRVFQLIVFILRPTTSQFLLILMTFITVVSNDSRQVFSEEKPDKPTAHYPPST